MTLEFNPEGKLKFNRFSKLGMWYILALSVIATVSIIGQFLIQNHLENQLSDSHVINVAGRQRMLSQRITKCVLLLKPGQDNSVRKEILDELKTSLHVWTIAHNGLQQGNDSMHLPGKNSAEIRSMFDKINDHHMAMRQSAATISGELNHNLLASYDSLEAPIQNILQHQRAFLDGMNQIVFQFDHEAKQKIARLSKLEYALLVISIVVILLEILFVFRPTAIQVNKTVNQLIASEKNAKKLSKEIGALYASLEKSYEDLSHVNVPEETPKIYAKTDRGGNIVFISDLFTELTGQVLSSKTIPLKDIFPGSHLNSDWMDEVVDHLSEGTSWQGVIRYEDRYSKDRWVDIMIVPALNEQTEVEEWLILGADITLQKQAEQNMRAKSKAEIEKKINQQKFRSVLILEGQEEERKRLAMDIHDGIGQMLTSLKFQIESIDLKKQDGAAEQKISEIQQLINQVIKEVRRVTFNLKPTVLGDYGLPAAVNVFIREIGKLTDIELVYTMEGDTSFRLPQKVENNIFRIIQEAINNAIKYSEASKIEVLLRITEENLVISVSDNGNGFDEKLVEARSVNIESGRGFFNMYERTEYINGHLDIKSTLGKGTVVVLSIPVKSLATV
ncbi:MAG TPA: type IV pili methyl-accepting chemotaxis transducer N-terminal domain-containing protein [Ohtaekwangia sp.]|uniref:sensor histidine kinase n=1 Tax=Ohtaekwangia sp. TaxID=2066019 RepID=UPI002F95CDC1